ncbi:uncharacterized protein LOC132535902 isoform X2 [Erinaceus europaeus]|uniref:Uncharacterized protein LOC132535902 isoform X2 n=1 Tax=Erinaceus europaeus TaxID=9365 RepID=A0ABM3WS72_ERIEU|nr:uncharacterized protein LOC132535902 isoform X2 [Erinaceus europaeus]
MDLKQLQMQESTNIIDLESDSDSDSSGASLETTSTWPALPCVERFGGSPRSDVQWDNQSQICEVGSLEDAEGLEEVGPFEVEEPPEDSDGLEGVEPLEMVAPPEDVQLEEEVETQEEVLKPGPFAWVIVLSHLLTQFILFSLAFTVYKLVLMEQLKEHIEQLQDDCTQQQDAPDEKVEQKEQLDTTWELGSQVRDHLTEEQPNSSSSDKSPELPKLEPVPRKSRLGKTKKSFSGVWVAKRFRASSPHGPRSPQESEESEEACKLSTELPALEGGPQRPPSPETSQNPAELPEELDKPAYMEEEEEEGQPPAEP